MKLFETTEGYINVLQNSNLSWELTLIRIEDELERIKTKYKLKKEDVFMEANFCNQQGFDIFVLGLKDSGTSNAYEEFILFLSRIFKIDVESLRRLDYLNLRRF